jgi:hypothetical protein
MKYNFSEPPQPTHYLGQVGDNVFYPTFGNTQYGSKVIPQTPNLPPELLALLTPQS